MKRIWFSIKITNTAALSILMIFSNCFQAAQALEGLPGRTPAQTPSRLLEMENLVVAQFGNQKPRKACDQGFVDIPGGLDNRNECWFQMVFQAMYARAVFEDNCPMQELLAKCQTDSSSQTQREIMDIITSEAFVDALPDFVHLTQVNFNLDKNGLKENLPKIKTALDNYKTQGDDFLMHLNSLAAFARSFGENGTDSEIETELKLKLRSISDDNLKIISYLLRTYQLKNDPTQITRPCLVTLSIAKPGNTGNVKIDNYEIGCSEAFEAIDQLIKKKRKYFTCNIISQPGQHWFTMVLWMENSQLQHLWLDSLYSWADQDFQDKGAEPERKLAITRTLMAEFDKIKGQIPANCSSITLEQKLLLDLLILKTETNGRAIPGANLPEDFHLKRVCSSHAELLQGEEAFKRWKVSTEEAFERAILLDRRTKALEQEVENIAESLSRAQLIKEEAESAKALEIAKLEFDHRTSVANEESQQRIAICASKVQSAKQIAKKTQRTKFAIFLIGLSVLVYVGMKFRKQSWSTIKAFGPFVRNRWSSLGTKKEPRKVKKSNGKALPIKTDPI